MAIDNIAVNGSSAQGQQLKSWIQQWYAFKQATQVLLAQMQHQNDGVSYATLETQFGIATGQGTNVYGIVFAAGNGASNGSGIGHAAFGPIDRLN
jgi:hypothetical protein